MTNNNERREKNISNIFKVIMYLTFVMDIIFVVLFSVFAFQSCDNSHTLEESNNQNHVNNSLHVKKGLQPKRLSIYDIDLDDYIYYSRVPLSSPVSIDFTLQSDLSDGNINTDTTYLEKPDDYLYRIYLDGFMVNTSTGDLSSITYIGLLYSGYQVTDTPISYSYRLKRITYQIDNSTWWFLNKHNSTDSDYRYDIIADDFKLLINNNSDITTDSFIVNFYRVATPTYFTFNKVFNYNAPWYTSLGSSYIQSGTTIMEPWVYNTGWAYKREDRLDVGYFLSGGQVFNRIVIESKISVNGDLAFLYDSASGKQYNAPENDWIYLNLYYENTDNNTRIIVNYRDLITGYDSTLGLPWSAYDDTTTWVNDDYRQIVFLGYLDEKLVTSINAFNNNNQTSVSGNIVGADTTNVFTLVGSAFTGLLPVLNTMLLPGITIGMLMFVPLVAMLVFAIIRIIKK